MNDETQIFAQLHNQRFTFSIIYGKYLFRTILFCQESWVAFIIYHVQLIVHLLEPE